MKLEFTKFHGIGNDFIFIDDLSQEIDLRPEQVAFLCDRHKGIGADGVILVRPSTNPDCTAYMHYINSDGSLAQMCGNGVRCFAKYLVDRGYVKQNEGSFLADTLSGPKSISFTVDEDSRLDFATVDMGRPILSPEAIPTKLEANAESAEGLAFVKEAALDSPWGRFSFTCVSMGNPHAVCFIDDFETLDDQAFLGKEKRLESFNLDLIGAYFESHEAFPEKVNVEFVTVESEGLRMRVYERGCAETMACGTGACAVNVAAALTGRSGRENDIALLGGTLHINWAADDHVYMRGAAQEVFSGTITL